MVAPLAGAWIEIDEKSCKKHRQKVAPLAGAWIEIPYILPFLVKLYCRSPRGSVD